MIKIKKLLKRDADFKTFTAVIMEPVTDAHGDIASEETIKKAAYEYLKNAKMQSKINHETPTKDVSLVESYLLKNDTYFDGQIIKKGAWLGEFEVNNEKIKEDIINENLTGVSIGALALTSKIEKREAKRNLDVVLIEEISIVDEPANQRKILKVNKNKGEVMDFESIMKKLAEDKELFKKLKSELKNKKDDDEDDDENEEEIRKSMGTKAYNKYLQRQNEFAKMKKSYEEIEKRAFKENLTPIKKYLKAENDLMDSLYKISKELPEDFKNIEKALLYSSNTIENINKMSAIGESGFTDDDIKSDENFFIIAKNKAKDENISLSKAYENVLKSNSKKKVSV